METVTQKGVTTITTPKSAVNAETDNDTTQISASTQDQLSLLAYDEAIDSPEEGEDDDNVTDGMASVAGEMAQTRRFFGRRPDDDYALLSPTLIHATRFIIDHRVSSFGVFCFCHIIEPCGASAAFTYRAFRWIPRASTDSIRYKPYTQEQKPEPNTGSICSPSLGPG